MGTQTQKNQVEWCAGRALVYLGAKKLLLKHSLQRIWSLSGDDEEESGSGSGWPMALENEDDEMLMTARENGFYCGCRVLVQRERDEVAAKETAKDQKRKNGWPVVLENEHDEMLMTAEESVFYLGCPVVV